MARMVSQDGGEEGGDVLKLATCDGPPYYYKVAYEKAERLLEKLK